MKTKAYRLARWGLIFRLFVSLAVAAGGWIYPAWFMSSDPTLSRDPDFRAGGVPLLVVGLSIFYALMAVRRFYNTRQDMHSDAVLKSSTRS